MLTLRQSPFDLIRGDLLESDLFKKLEQQLHSAETQKAERVPAAEVHETPEAYTIALELPGVDKGSIDVKATDRTLVISAERRSGVEAPRESAMMNRSVAQAPCTVRPATSSGLARAATPPSGAR